MSASAEKDTDTTLCCASCGASGSDDIKLKQCACKLVKYCSVKCQKDHRPKHKRECKQRVAELRDEVLFKQPESTHLGDCPICCLPLSIDSEKSPLAPCCSKRICDGCNLANQLRELEGRLQLKCPFCREVVPRSAEELIEKRMKRVEANDPVAMCDMGTERYQEGDYKAAFEHMVKAAALGDVKAHYQVSTMYGEGRGVEKDEKKELHHLTEASIGGHPIARYNLGCLEMKNGQINRAVKHFIIAAKLGFDPSLKQVKNLFKAGRVSKEDFAAALRGHQAAIEATKSPQRKEAAIIFAIRLASERDRQGG